MKHVILESMNKIKIFEVGIGRSIMKPTYLLVQRYGRSPEPVLREVAEAFGKKTFFSLRKEATTKETFLERFLIEAKKSTDLGKAFDGFVLIELTGEEKEGEREALYEYIKNNSREITCAFTVKNEQTADALYGELVQYFPFLRKVSEECYSPEEQREILVSTLRLGGSELTGEAEEWFTEKVADMKWKPEDHVENKLKNLANALVYEQIMKGESCLWISSEQLQEALNLQTEPETEKIPIGFAPPAKKETEKDAKGHEKNGREMVA